MSKNKEGNIQRNKFTDDRPDAFKRAHVDTVNNFESGRLIIIITKKNNKQADGLPDAVERVNDDTFNQ